MIVGEAPGETEDERGIPFCGKSGRKLEETLRQFGVELRRDCWIVNAARCRPPGNELPPKAVEHCRPLTVKDIKELQPEVVILLGASAVKSVIGWLWKEDVDAINRWVGWQIPCQSINAWICPTWHPADVLRSESGKEGEVTTLWWERHLKQALRLKRRPWDKVPDYRSMVRTEVDDRAAAKAIGKLVSQGKPLALDYECTMLKPDSDKFEVVSCALSDGDVALAYPWYGRAVEATKEVLESGIPLVASNYKYEIRVSLSQFGIPGKSWYWDTMQMAHLIDNRSKVTSVKFQAFTLLGADSWDEHIKPYLTSKGSNTANRIKELDQQQLLTYNALDALLEIHVMRRQQELLKIKEANRACRSE